MPGGALGSLWGGFRSLFEPDTLTGISDAALPERYVSHADQQASEFL